MPSVTPLRWGTGGSGPQGRSVRVTWTSRVAALCHVLLGGPVSPGQVHLCLGEVRRGRELLPAPPSPCLRRTLLWACVGGAGSLCGRSDTAGGPAPELTISAHPVKDMCLGISQFYGVTSQGRHRVPGGGTGVLP